MSGEVAGIGNRYHKNLSINKFVYTDNGMSGIVAETDSKYGVIDEDR